MIGHVETYGLGAVLAELLFCVFCMLCDVCDCCGCGMSVVVFVVVIVVVGSKKTAKEQGNSVIRVKQPLKAC